MREAISDFLKITGLSDNDPERREIIDSARLTLAYINFELSSYDKAIAQLNKISPEFHDYPDVLLAFGWCYLKTGNYSAALDALNKLFEKFPRYYNLEEATFLKGQCYLKLGYFNFAIEEFDKIVNPDSTHSNADSTNLTVQQLRIEELKKDMDALEARLIRSVPLRSERNRINRKQENPATVKQSRENLIREILEERKEFNRLSAVIDVAKKRAEKKSLRKKWEAYAEYGQVRALYLKSINLN